MSGESGAGGSFSAVIVVSSLAAGAWLRLWSEELAVLLLRLAMRMFPLRRSRGGNRNYIRCMKWRCGA